MKTIKEGFLRKNIDVGFAGAVPELEKIRDTWTKSSSYSKQIGISLTKYLYFGGILAEDLIKILATDHPEISDSKYLKINIIRDRYDDKSSKWILRFSFFKDPNTIQLYKKLITDEDIYDVDKYKTFPIFLKKIVEPILKDIDTFRDYINKNWG